MNDAWSIARACFDTDDGSLPSVDLVDLSPAGVSAVYAMLRRRSRLSGAPAVFWSKAHGSAIAVDSVPDAAGRVAAGEAEPFHFCIEGIVAGGVTLPVLGVLVFASSVDLDYRMGLDWGRAEVNGFFELLRDCCALDAGASVVPAATEGPPCPDRFLEARSRYREGSAGRALSGR